MSTGTVKQLYNDVVVLTEKSLTNHAMPSLVTLFNANLAEAKKEYPDDPIIAALTNVSTQSIMADMLVMTGQLMQATSEAGMAKAIASM